MENSECKKSKHEKRAYELFLSGYNCAQSTFAAFSDVTGIPEKESLQLVSAMGGGLSGQRSACGAVTSVLLVLGRLFGYSDSEDYDGKVRLYADGCLLSDRFREKFGNIICAELLCDFDLSKVPSKRDEEYYNTRPCARFCAGAARILDEYLAEHGYEGLFEE